MLCDETEFITGKIYKTYKMSESDLFLYPPIMYAIKYKKKTENFYQDKTVKCGPVEEFVEGKLL